MLKAEAASKEAAVADKRRMKAFMVNVSCVIVLVCCCCVSVVGGSWGRPKQI